MSRAKGDELENLVSKDLGINKTTNSGAKWDNADLTNRDIIIECKVKSTPGLSGAGPELKKLIQQAKKHSKDWAYIQENQMGKFAIIDYNLFVTLWKHLYDDHPDGS